jgi:hypothetical protein
MLQRGRTGRTWKHAARPCKSGTREHDCLPIPRWLNLLPAPASESRRREHTPGRPRSLGLRDHSGGTMPTSRTCGAAVKGGTDGLSADRHLSTAKRVIPSDTWPTQTCAAVGREATARMQPRTTESVGRKRTVGHDCKKIGPNNRSLSQEQTGATMLALSAGGHASEKKTNFESPIRRGTQHPSSWQ